MQRISLNHRLKSGCKHRHPTRDLSSDIALKTADAGELGCHGVGIKVHHLKGVICDVAGRGLFGPAPMGKDRLDIRQY